LQKFTFKLLPHECSQSRWQDEQNYIFIKAPTYQWQCGIILHDVIITVMCLLNVCK